ncbi:MAG: hypothetical protein QM723_34425 [Myxococcaceae bacterium]
MTAFLLAAPAFASEGPEDDEHSAEPPGEEGETTELPEFAGADRPLFEEATRQLSLMRSSTYVHKTSVDEAAGRFDFDCSGFISYALAHASRAAYRELRAFAHHRPLAKDFVAVASNTESKHFAALPRVSELQRGDLLAWLKPADVTSRNTGHVMLVAGMPRERSPGEWEIPIIDSTAAPHGKSDARKSRHATGLGEGVVVVAVDARGAPTGYKWSTWSKSKLHSTQVVLLRVKP